MNAHTVRSELNTTLSFFTRPIAILRAYRPEFLRPDLIAGLTIAVILIPQAMAYALIAELPPQVGLYTGIVGSIVGALWGSTIQLQTGPSNAASLLVLSVLLPIASPDSPDYLVTAGLLALMVGIFRLLLGLARMGLLVNFVSDSVIIGFTAGAGMLILFNQMRHLLRLSIASAPSLPDTLAGLVSHLNETHPLSLLLGIATIAGILILKRTIPRLPGPLIAIVITGGAAAWFGLDQLGVRLVGQIPSGLPPITRPPVLNIDLIGSLSTGALAVAAIGLVEAMSIARTIASQTGQRINSNQEFVGQGLANIACSFTSGYPCSGSFARSAVCFESGARTPLANVFCGLFVLAVMLLLGSLAAYIPLPAMAGIVIVIAIGLVDRVEIVRIWRGARGDRVIMITTLLATLLLPLQFAVLSGILMSLAYYLLRTSTPQVRPVVPDEKFEFLVSPTPDRPACPQLGVIEILGDLYFGAAHHVEEKILAERARYPGQRYLLLRMFVTQHIDISGVHILESILRTYRDDGGDVFISRYNRELREVLRDTGFLERLGEDHLLGRDMDAIGILFYHTLDPAICIYECPVRTFLECQNLPKRLDLVGEYRLPDLPAGDTTYIDPSSLWAEIQSDHPPYIVDVREIREYDHSHIPGADSVPLSQLIDDPKHFRCDQSTVLVCESGRRSLRAAALIARHQNISTRVLRGGMNAWESKNLLEAHHGHGGP
jgi:SulP family sulfate permease